jgi:hypothetical protein
VVDVVLDEDGFLIQQELAGAIDVGLRYRLEPSGGLLADMIFIARNTVEGQQGRPADAVGVTAATWNRWMSHARGIKGTRPSAESRVKIARGVRLGIARHWHVMNPSRAEVTARVNWNGYYNPIENRTVKLDGLNLQQVITQFAYGSYLGMESTFHDAVKDRYGVPVIFTEVESVDFYR